MLSERNNEKLEIEADALAGKRILVVEDSWHLAQALVSLLEDLGLGVVGPAGTVGDAETLLAAQTPDLAIVDYNLDGTMAYGLIELLNKRRVPIVVVTAYEELPPLDGMVAAILHKPIRSSTLLGTLRQVLADAP